MPFVLLHFHKEKGPTGTLHRFSSGLLPQSGGAVLPPVSWENGRLPIFSTDSSNRVESLVYLHAGVLIIVKGTAGHAISPDFYPVKLCRFSGADRLLDRFKYILCHVPLTAGLFHRGLVSGGFRTLTGSFATLGAVWLPD